MPELAEVEYYRRQWERGIAKRVVGVELNAQKRVFRGTDTRLLVVRLNGATLMESLSHGKQLLFRFSKRAWLGVHLGMTGELRCEPADFSRRVHDHLVLRQSARTLVYSDARQFGRVRFHQGTAPPDWWTTLPPEIHSSDFTVRRLGSVLEQHARAPIKAVLLRQNAFPGVGNWMADEILWRLRLHPATRAGEMAGQALRLWKAVRDVASGALRYVAPRFSDPPSSWLFRHRWKAGGRCPRDGELLRREEIGGRTTAWCPRCQRSP